MIRIRLTVCLNKQEDGAKAMVDRCWKARVVNHGREIIGNYFVPLDEYYADGKQSKISKKTSGVLKMSLFDAGGLSL